MRQWPNWPALIAPGGTLVISEGNMRSLQAVTLRWIKKLLGRERAEIMHTPAGIEFWEETSTARLMTRQADIPWLIAEFRRHGLELVERRAGQFTEIYVLLPWKPLRRLVHAINNFWFRWIRLAGPAYGNLLVLRRPTHGRIKSGAGRSPGLRLARRSAAAGRHHCGRARHVDGHWQSLDSAASERSPVLARRIVALGSKA